MIDVIVVKKYPIYFTELLRDKNKWLPRSYQSYLSLQEKQIERTQKEISLFIHKNQKMPPNELEEKVEEIKRNTNSYFKPWYKIKVIDTIKQENEGVLTLFDLSEEGYSNIAEGERYRISQL